MCISHVVSVSLHSYIKQGGRKLWLELARKAAAWGKTAKRKTLL